MSRQAALLIADEIYYNLHGKATLQGIYNDDLVIPTDPSTAPQLLFFFIIQTDVSNPFKSLSVEVTLPQTPPVSGIVFVAPPELLAALIQAHPQRTVYTVKHPLLITAPALRPGRIEAKVIHEAGEIPVTAQWIRLNAPPIAAVQTN